MVRLMLVVGCFLSLTSLALGRHHFAQIIAVDADKGTVTYKIGKKDAMVVVTTPITNDCIIREGFYRLGKPARLEEKELIVNGLKNFVFQNASAEVPLRVNLYTADDDDAAKKIRKGEIVKILVNPGK